MEVQQRDGQRGQAPQAARLDPVKRVCRPDTAATEYEVVRRLSEVRHLLSVFTDVSDQWTGRILLQRGLTNALQNTNKAESGIESGRPMTYYWGLQASKKG
jgi:hypothetical protein